MTMNPMKTQEIIIKIKLPTNTKSAQKQPFHESIVTSKADHSQDIAKEVQDGVGVTERQVEYNGDDAHRNQEPTHYPICQHQLKVDLIGHEDGVVEWVVNSSVPVRGMAATMKQLLSDRKNICVAHSGREMDLLSDSKPTMQGMITIVIQVSLKFFLTGG